MQAFPPDYKCVPLPPTPPGHFVQGDGEPSAHSAQPVTPEEQDTGIGTAQQWPDTDWQGSGDWHNWQWPGTEWQATDTGTTQQWQGTPTGTGVHPQGTRTATGIAPTTGAAWVREQRRRLGVAAGTTNPFKKELQHAEKQLRKRNRDGARVDVVIAAQLKVEHYKELSDVWVRKGDQ